MKTVEKAPHVDELTITPREPSPMPPPVQISETPASSSSVAITKEELLSIMNSTFKDLKEYVYESQRESFKNMQAFKEEILSLTKSLQLNIDEQYIKL